MRGRTVSVIATALLTTGAAVASAQSDEDFAAYYALVNTHTGVFAPLSAGPVRGVLRTGDAVAFRASSYKEQGEAEGVRTIGVTVGMDLFGDALMNATVGYTMPGCENCDPTVMIGGDVVYPLWSQLSAGGPVLTANVQGSAGFGKYTGGSAITALTLAAALPLGLSVRQQNGSSLSAFFTPGFAWGSAGTSGNMTSGTRPFFGLGGEWMTQAGWAMHLGVQKVMLERAPTTLGGGFAYRFGAAGGR